LLIQLSVAYISRELAMISNKDDACVNELVLFCSFQQYMTGLNAVNNDKLQFYRVWAFGVPGILVVLVFWIVDSIV